MVGFHDMIRLVLTITTAFLISFGAISKNIQASELLNHVTEEHHEHVHSQDDKHVTHSDHHADDSEETGHPEDDATPQTNHSHSFEMSLLALSINVISSHCISISAPVIQIQQSVESYQSNLNISNFSSAVFRPPIV